MYCSVGKPILCISFSIVSSLSDERVLNSNVEMSAVVQAYMECLRFCLNKHMGKEEEHVEMQDYLIQQVRSLFHLALVKILKSRSLCSFS